MSLGNIPVNGEGEGCQEDQQGFFLTLQLPLCEL